MSSNVWPKAVPLLILAGLLAYANCINKTFVFDDDAWIVGSTTLDDPPAYLKSIQGRPLLGLTNLLLHRFGRNNPIGHHILNVFIHLAATLALYGLVRRSLLRPRFRGRFDGRAPYFAFAVALLWMLHPLQVQSVTYIIQRGESLAGLFYLLILYALLRADEVAAGACYARGQRFAWQALAVASLLLGYTSKEIMASAPAAVLLFDRIFLAASWRDLLRRRWVFYLFFLGAWGGFTAWNLLRATKTEGGIGFGMEAVTPRQYALTETGVILYYLQISVWPRGLSIDYYGWPWWSTLDAAMPEAAIVGALLLVTGVLLLWRPAIGFVCAWFFIILAPTSSVLPIVDAVFEHRMYLSLASVVVIGVFIGDWLMRRLGGARWRPAALTAVAMALGILTILRNEEYRSRAVIWEIAAQRMPNSVRAKSNYAHGLIVEERQPEAIPALQRALELAPNDLTSLINLATVYESMGDYSGAEVLYRRLKNANPADSKHWRLHGAILLVLGRWDDAADAYQRASELSPELAEAHYGRAAALVALDRQRAADEAAATASALDPHWPETVLALARTTILDARTRSHPEAVRSALMWAELGLRYANDPTPEQRDTLGLCHAARGDFPRAAVQSRLSLASTPAGPWGAVHRDRLQYYERRQAPWPPPRP